MKEEITIKKLMLALLCLCLAVPVAAAEARMFDYRFADAQETAQLLPGNREYYEQLTQNDLDFRMQKKGATLEEMEAFAAAQALDYTDAEKAAIDSAMTAIESACAERGFALPPTDGIVFAKTTMAEECDAGAYTHGTQIYMGESIMACGTSDDPDYQAFFREVVAHELFHCLTRNHPDFRAAMYAVLGFTVADADFELSDAIRERMISNPDVEHHDAWATFDIGGQKRDCVVVFTTGKPFEQPGDSFFDDMVTGLVPIDDLSTMYTSDEASNFWDVFGRNTDYVIDPEETLADNFSYAILYGMDNPDDYATPEIIEAIEAILQGYAAEAADEAA